MADFDFIDTDAQTIYETVMSYLMDYCSEALYPGDERRIFGEAIAALLISVYNTFDDRAKQRMLQYARGEVLDAIGDRYGVARAAAAAASATFRFTVSAVQSSNIIIPAETRVTTDGSVYFATVEAVVLQAGDLYVDTTGVCTEGGAKYNGYTAGQIATLVDLIPYISASNTTVSAGGDDGEPYTDEGDDRYRERIRLAPSAMSTAGPESAYRYYVLSADPDIIDVSFDVPSAATITIYPLMRGGELPDTDTIDKIKAALSDDVRPLTDYVTVTAPTQVEYSINIKYYCDAANETAVIQAVEGDDGAIDQYIEWQSSELGRNVNPDKLREFLYAAGVTRVDITAPIFAQLTSSKVAKLTGEPTITHDTE